MAPKRLLEQPPPADSFSEDSSESEAAENEEEEVEKKNDTKSGVAGADKSSDSDEDDDDDNEEEEEEEEEEEKKEKVKSPEKKRAVSKPNDSRSGSETESDDTPPSPSLSGFTIEPIVSKPMDIDSVKPKKKAPVKPNNKRESEPEEKESKDKKKRKVASNCGGGSSRDDEDFKKASGVALLWSEDDEIALLKGMTDFKAKKGTDPKHDMGAFHDFIKEQLNADVSKSKVSEKIRRLKKKYLNNAAKSENDEDPVFSKPHELRSFQLSKKILGNVADKTPSNGSLVDDKDSKSNVKKKPIPSTPNSKTTTPTVLALPKMEPSVKKEKKREKVQPNGKLVKAEVEIKQEEVEDDEDEDEDTDEEEEEEDLSEKYPFLYNSLRFYSMKGVFGMIVEENMPWMRSSELKVLEDKWKKLFIEDGESYLKKIDLIREQNKLFLDSLKSM